MPALRNSAKASKVFAIGLPSLPDFPNLARLEDHFMESCVDHPRIVRKQLNVLYHPPAHDTTSEPASSRSQQRTSTANRRISAARWVIPARTYGRISAT